MCPSVLLEAIAIPTVFVKPVTPRATRNPAVREVSLWIARHVLLHLTTAHVSPHVQSESNSTRVASVATATPRAHVCSGPLSSDCQACDSFRLASTGECVEACSFGIYRDSSRYCQMCDPTCGDTGCSEPGAHNCTTTCTNLIKHTLGSGAIQCVSTCPSGYFATKDSNGSHVCSQCSPLCGAAGCISSLADGCLSCKTASYNGSCVATCPSNTYLNTTLAECQPCNPQCVRSAGPSTSQCTACDGLKSLAL